MEIQIVPYDNVFLNLSWIWLNDNEIKWLTNTPEFTKESQLSWFNSLKLKNDYLIWGIKANDTPIGVCGLKNITQSDCEYWGYIGDKDYWGKGIGKIMMKELEQNAKNKNLKSIWLKVIKTNERAIQLYKRMEYEIEYEDNNLIYMRKKL